jgi:hypothetical protein
MTARILDGKALAATIRAELKDRVSVLAERGVVPVAARTWLANIAIVPRWASARFRWSCPHRPGRMSWRQ